MCGIFGIYNLDYKNIDKNVLEKMTKLIKHRGPDDEGYLLINTKENTYRHCFGDDSIEYIKKTCSNLKENFNANLGFGYRRLAILDLTEKGHQPMSNKNKDIWIIFNGEIYNYLEIRENLISKGYVFHSNCDTEVILAAYEEWGEFCVNQFNGMWSFAIWDFRGKKLFCSRDRMGVKPFYYYKSDNIFIWSSEIKQIVKSGLVKIEPNYSNIYDYLLLSRINIDKKTFFKDIQELPPAHNLIIKNNELILTRYWDIDENKRLDGLSDKEYSDKFLEIFSNAVKLRLRSDVPLGIALSGGLDSSSIACIASKYIKNEIKTFSVYYENDKKYDEREYIEEVLKTGNFKKYFFTTDGKIRIKEISDWIFLQDEPCISASPYSAYKNYENVRKAGITVVLNGQGGDEILAGYHYYFKYLYLSLLKSGKIKEFINQLKLYDNVYKMEIKQKLLLMIKLFFRLIFSDNFLKNYEKYEMSTEKYYSKDLLKYKHNIDLKKKFSCELTNNLYNSLTLTSIPHLLHWEDRNSMGYSIESRVPFLDFNLVEFMFQIPNSQKINGAETKIILRNAMKGILPEKIRKRKDKVGFATPTDLWTNDKLKEEIIDIFSSQKFKERGIFNFSKILNNFIKDYKNKNFKENEVWKILSLELWFRIFID